MQNRPVKPPQSFYFYKAKITQAYDGDTVTANIDLGLGSWLMGQKLRLYGIDTPELRGLDREEAIHVRDYVRERLIKEDDPEHMCIIETFKDKSGKYGRWLATIWYPDEDSDEGEFIELNDHLLNCGMAKPYDK